MKLRCLCLLLLVLVTAVPAHADPVCDKIAAAMLAITDQPGLRQRMIQPQSGGTVLMETVSLPDAMYMRESPTARWRKVPLDRVKRREMAEQALKLLPLSECSGPRDGQDGGVAVSVYSYSQPNPLSPGKPNRSSIWVGKGDGLLRRLLLEDGSYQTMEYGAFAAPGP